MLIHTVLLGGTGSTRSRVRLPSILPHLKGVLAPSWEMYMPNIMSGVRQFGPGGTPSLEFRVTCWATGSQSKTVRFAIEVLTQGSEPWASASVPSLTPPKSVSGTSHFVQVMFSM